MIEIIDGEESIVMALGDSACKTRMKMTGMTRAEVYQLRTEKRTNGDGGRSETEKKAEKDGGRSELDKFMASTPKLVFPTTHIEKIEEVGRHDLRVRIKDGVIDFSVNNSYSKKNIHPKDGLKVGLRALKIIRDEVSKMPDGTFLRNTPSSMDGLGDKRARLYVKAGFGKLDGEGDSMKAVVKNGKITPIKSKKYRYFMNNGHYNNRE